MVDGSTRWSGRGDLHSLSEIASSLAAGNDPRVEGRGTRQSLDLGADDYVTKPFSLRELLVGMSTSWGAIATSWVAIAT